MGFFKSISNFVSHVFSNIDDSAHKIADLMSNPKEAMHLKEDLMSPRDVTLNGFFEKVDPVIDVFDPGHNEVQRATTGSRETAKQSPYFQTIAPIVLNAFFPGAGTMAQGISSISDGQTGKGIAQFGVGYFTQVGGAYTSSAAEAGVASSSTIGQIGSAIKIGATAYAIYDSKDKLLGYYGPGSAPPNMVTEGQSQKGISLSNSAGAYSSFTHTEDTTAAAAALNMAKEKEKSNSVAILALGGLVLIFMR